MERVSAGLLSSRRPSAAEAITMMNADECWAKVREMDDKANQCFSIEAADMYRELATEWRQLQAQIRAQEVSAS